MTAELEYIMDSFPVAACDNIRITNSKMLKGKKWRGYTASMHRYFYGVKVQMLINQSGIPIRFCFTPGNQADAKSIARMLEGLPPESQVDADSAYTNYHLEDLYKNDFVYLRSQRKSNSKRPDNKEDARLITKKRKKVEAIISNIKKMFPKTIHAVTLKGFLIKLISFIFEAQFSKIIA